MCYACYERQPERVATWTAGCLARLGPAAPDWLADLAAELGQRCHPSVALQHLGRIAGVLSGATTGPAAVVEALRTDTRRHARATATLLVEFLDRRGLGSFNDRVDRLRGWRHRQLERLPARLRPAASAFVDHLVRQQRRARLYGTRGLADRTINRHLTNLVHFAELLASRRVDDWAAVSASDIEAFLTAADVPARLATCRAFFAYARRRKLVLVDPAAGISRGQRKGYAGRILTTVEQRVLLRRWTAADANPQERVVGLLCLLHAASVAELRHLTVEQIDLVAGRVQLGRRSVPLDPLTTDALGACLEARAELATGNPHLLVNYQTRLHDRPCSSVFPASLLAPLAVTPRVLRQTRLADLTQRLDPRVAAAVAGITQEAALHYLVGTVDHEASAFVPAAIAGTSDS